MAAASGVQAKDEVVAAFQDVKMGKKTRFVQFKVTEDKKFIEVDKICLKADLDQKCGYKEFLDQLPANDGRYIVYDFELETNQQKRNPLVFFVWIPDDASVRVKMLYSSSKDALKKKLDGVNHEIQGGDKGDLDYDEVMKTLVDKVRT